MVEEKAKKPENEVVCWGFGTMLNKADELIKLLDRQNFLASMQEKKLNKIIELLEKI